MATAAQVAEFREANRSLVLLAQRDLTDFWSALRLTGDPGRVRDDLLDFFPELLTAYGDAAALLGADWFDMLRDAPPSAASFRAALARPVDTEQAEASARWALGPLFADEPDPGSALSLLMGSAQRLVLQPGRVTVWDSVRRDPVSRSFARVPSGLTTCKWCVMLASRGFAYTSDEAAGQGIEFHDNCDCVIVPGRNRDDLPEDYDLDYFINLYQDGSGVGRDLPAD